MSKLLFQANLINTQDTIKVEVKDYKSLQENTWLNDTIIDFYLKWFQNEKMSESDRQRTHIFSTLFYSMLASQMTKSDIRSNWTKNVNLFEKDFIVVPVCEKKHWFVAVICSPDFE
jgi:Ulp1 family protease